MNNATAPGAYQRYSGRLLREAKGALYMFPKIDAKRFNIHDDQKMVLDFLLQEKVLLVQGTAFNWPWPDHVRIVTLPREDDLEMAISRFGRFLSGYHQL